MKKRGRSRAATLRCLGLRTVRRVARERGKVRGKRLGHGPSHVTSGSARYITPLLSSFYGPLPTPSKRRFCKGNQQAPMSVQCSPAILRVLV
jgi:hypothetical protein